jgi:phosphoglycolate phosphatase-like HAD superfamily hydrolase
MKQLAIFDIDGTLMRTAQLDADCFLRAVTDEVGALPISTNLQDYTHITDSGITQQIFRDHLGRAPHDEELVRLQQRFADLLAQSLASRPARSLQVPGAADMLAQLPDAGWAIAIATGGWRACALLKLEKAGIAIDGVPAAFGEDAIARTEIVATALSRSHIAYARTRFERVVSIGDGVWDVDAARALNLAFVGVRPDEHDAPLRARGVTHVLPDFADFDRLLRSLHEAQVPMPRGAPDGARR